MSTYQFEAMDATGQEIKDVIEAPSEEEAQATIRKMGYFVTKISIKKGRAVAAQAAAGTKKKRGFSIGVVGSAKLTSFTRQLSILQDAGLPILRSLRVLEGQQKPGKLKFTLQDVCEEIEGGSTLSEAMGKSPRVFNRLFVNMIKAGEASGALEIILQRLSEFLERAQALKRRVIGAMVYPAVVITVAVTILTGIMLKIVPSFQKIFNDFDTELPTPTLILIGISDATASYWYMIPILPVSIFLFVKLIRKFPHGRMGWDLYLLKLPIIGMMVEKTIVSRTTRTLGTLVSSGVPILEALTITRETAGNAMFERLFGKVTDAIREGETISKPLKEYSQTPFHPVALFFSIIMFAGPAVPLLFLLPNEQAMSIGPGAIAGAGILGGLAYMVRLKGRVIDDLVVNMVDVGEETGELDSMLNKVADTFDDEVKVISESLMSIMEPVLIVGLGGAVGFIVVSLFMPLVSLIQTLS